MDVVTQILEKTARDAEKYKPTKVEKHLDVDLDLGCLLAIDPNELNAKLLGGNKEDYLLNLTRDNTQLLLNQIWELPSERNEEAIVVKLPVRRFILPRSKPIPKPRPLTKWQKFAKEKGIVSKKKKPKLSWDDQLKKWVPLYGFKRVAARNAKEWLLEVPVNANPTEDQFTKHNEAKSERVAKNELQRLRNVARARKVKLPRVGFTSTDASTAKDLQAAVTVARSSTASLGKFQGKLPRETEARGVADITPGATGRKRKLPPLSGAQEKSENLAIVETVLNKKPKLDIEKAVARHLNQEQSERSEQKNSEKPKAGRRNQGKKRKNSNSAQKGKNAQKPKAGRGQRKGKGNVGRKRR